MVSTITKPNHYQTLGIAPTANSDEIASAFAKAISRFQPRPFGGVAEVSVAYETLRDPVRRRAYDASLGLRPEQPRFIGAAAAQALEARLSAPAPQPRPQASPEPPVEARPTVEPQAGGGNGFDRAGELRFDEFQHRPEWKRSGIIIGAVIAAAAVPGALLGFLSGSESEEVQVRTTISLPPAKPRPIVDAPTPTPVQDLEKARVEQPRRSAVTAAPIETNPAPELPATSGLEPAEVAQSVPPAAGEALAEAVPVEPVTASMPLPNAVVASTIRRIGYACGQVASTAPVDGAAGVFKVTCTSGHAYRAAPVRGRYHFRRWDRR